VSLLAIALLGWFLSHANLVEVWHHVERAELKMLLVGFVFVVLTYIARTFRWQVLLRPLGRVRFSTVFRATIVGFAALGLLPARAGDVLRPYMVARKEGLSAPATFAPGSRSTPPDWEAGGFGARRVSGRRPSAPPPTVQPRPPLLQRCPQRRRPRAR